MHFRLPNWFALLKRARMWGPKRRPPSSARVLRLECLQARQTMAGDVGFASSTLAATAGDGGLQEVSANFELVSAAALGSSAEGEAAPDLVAFAKALADAGVVLFGADWEATTTLQTQLFQDGAVYLPYVEISNGDRTVNDIGLAQNIVNVPTWQFADQQRYEGPLTLQQLSTVTGISIPQSSVPSMVPIAAQSVLQGSPLHIPIDAYDPNGNPLTITVSSSQPSNVTAQILQNNQSARITTEGFGEMVFQLFNAEAPRPVGRFVALAQSGFYNTVDSNRMTFHRAAQSFVIQGGDPLGTGQGGSTLGNFDDQFNLNLQHNRSGVLSYAKTFDDTNDSQFFITAGATRFLDYNHSIFGQLIEGDKTRAGIDRTAVVPPPVGQEPSNRPVNDVVIQSVEIFNDSENGLLRLIAVGQAGSTSEITVTVTDTEGNQATQKFTVSVAVDPVNGAPFLEDIPSGQALINQPISLHLASIDEEGDPVLYSAIKPNASVPYEASYNSLSGEILVQPNAGFIGTTELYVIVERNPRNPDPDSTEFDFQRVSIQFRAPLSISIDRPEIFERGGTATATVTRQLANLNNPLLVTLNSSNKSKATVPLTVQIPANQASATFTITAVDTAVVEGVQRVAFSVEATDFVAAAAGIDIIDDDAVSPWHNALLPADVNKDGLIVPLDVLLVINQIGRLGTSLLPIPQRAVTFFVDTDGDFFLTPIDVLRVINAINRRESGEGEANDSETIQTSALSLWLVDEANAIRNRRWRAG